MNELEPMVEIARAIGYVEVAKAMMRNRLGRFTSSRSEELLESAIRCLCSASSEWQDEMERQKTENRVT